MTNFNFNQFTLYQLGSSISMGNWRASVASETLTGVTQSKIGDVYWRASVASETLTGVKMKKSGMFIYLFVYMFGRTYVILYFDPRVFVLVMWSTPSKLH